MKINQILSEYMTKIMEVIFHLPEGDVTKYYESGQEVASPPGPKIDTDPLRPTYTQADIGQHGVNWDAVARESKLAFAARYLRGLFH